MRIFAATMISPYSWVSFESIALITSTESSGGRDLACAWSSVQDKDPGIAAGEGFGVFLLAHLIVSVYWEAYCQVGELCDSFEGGQGRIFAHRFSNIMHVARSQSELKIYLLERDVAALLFGANVSKFLEVQVAQLSSVCSLERAPTISRLETWRGRRSAGLVNVLFTQDCEVPLLQTMVAGPLYPLSEDIRE